MLTQCLNTVQSQKQIMTNRHVKVINGRKYFYESIRVGAKVTSKYICPVERVRRARKIEGEDQEEVPSTDEDYIG